MKDQDMLPPSPLERLLPASPLLTAEDIALLIRVHVRTVRYWCETGELKGFKIGKKILRFFREDVVSFLRRRHADQRDC
jgi:excisionase family DNA binding protein